MKKFKLIIETLLFILFIVVITITVEIFGLQNTTITVLSLLLTKMLIIDVINSQK